jgi:hypothetical protein
MAEITNMIKNFPGSDDTRGTTTRISYQEVQTVGESYGPEMRVDEYSGPLGNYLRYYNLTRQTVNVCKIVEVDGLKSINEAMDTVLLFDNFSTAVGNLETIINNKINAIVTELALDPVSFWLTKVDVLNSYISPSGLHNASGTHTVFVTINYDVIIYGQFTPNPLIEAVPEPEPCTCDASVYTVNQQFYSTNSNGVIQANTFNTGTPVTFNGSTYIRAQGRAALGATASVITNNFLTGGQYYTLRYEISANLTPILTPGTNSEIEIKVNGVVAGVFPLDTVVKEGYIQFLAPTGWATPYTQITATYTKSFADRLSYPSATATWHVNLRICSSTCEEF